ncbi:septum formation initiator family protein (plasmid) [Pontibacillus sp. ALD_SL1]|uniref:FtsB family cell division protein n=1 Tax=Pontibacillus sp. ALD_SL1 TaxID=2777185 RepID=UPI001A97D14F|nr:septum formation initiator family protein [Pontibacillus sp. ALD_SL1]QST03061.1 septum formation initiator family protein [Pontibacillus sp. ALD_SL1]
METNKEETISKWKRLKDSNTIKVFIAIVLVCLFIYFFVYQTLSFIQLRYQNSQLNEELVELRNTNEILKQDIEKIQTNQYIEETARERLGMVKTNETPIQVIEEKPYKMEEEALAPERKMNIYMDEWYKGLIAWFKEEKG